MLKNENSVEVVIYGAGSIGNHMAHACRNKDWHVTMVDPDSVALERTRREIYPSRYGQWDESIDLVFPDDVDGTADLVIIGTPPDLHMEIASAVLRGQPPQVMLIEKPLCTPDLDGYEEVAALVKKTGTIVLTGYNHVVTKNTKKAEQILTSHDFGKPQTIMVRWLEHWGGIFGAHPWLSGPSDSYLGYSVRGGGACGEHSHGINLFQHFARFLGQGDIKKVSCMMSEVEDGAAQYDRVSSLNVQTDSGMTGLVVQDVVTEPAVKMLRIQFEKGYLEWYASYDADHDAVLWQCEGKQAEAYLIPRERPDDFVGEIDEVERILQGSRTGGAISLEAGYQTMRVIGAAYSSHRSGQTVEL
ncbi:Gfo/Idh/MocA family protein [Candidatus Electrothrix sp.]|uniref:Gfo/Idh/MocA family protein n=3 Tax=Candidatus Electrothrix sp. TaxID=2170559 RepID=UPI0040563D62